MKLYVASINKIVDQATIADEETGRSVAIVYDKKDAAVLSAAFELLEVCKAVLRAPSDGSRGPGYSTRILTQFNLDACATAIAKAEESIE
jgi:hypothetical protein